MIPNRSQFLSKISIAFGLFLLASEALAHPLPDIPVRSYFGSDGSLEIRVEVDSRALLKDPESEGYLLKAMIENQDAEEIREMEQEAEKFLSERLRFLFNPTGAVEPKFEWEFRKLGDLPWVGATAETVLVGSWRPAIPHGSTEYRVEAVAHDDSKVGIPLNVVFLNFVNRVQVERYAVLFPGETSFAFDLKQDLSSGAATAENTPATQSDSKGMMSVFISEIRRGFLHVVPLGMDHILFVLGIFLLSRKWKPLLLQVTAFTIAHTLTLWLASAGIVKVSPSVVEPIIAASIVVVALENIFFGTYRHWRLAVVFIFGLIHGLGFAGVMATRLDSTTSLIVGLLGINIGVELGQLLVIVAAFLLTAYIAKNQERYRRWIVIPGSILIACAGCWWLFERTIGS